MFIAYIGIFHTDLFSSDCASSLVNILLIINFFFSPPSLIKFTRYDSHNEVQLSINAWKVGTRSMRNRSRLISGIVIATVAQRWRYVPPRRFSFSISHLLTSCLISSLASPHCRVASWELFVSRKQRCNFSLHCMGVSLCLFLYHKEFPFSFIQEKTVQLLLSYSRKL